MGNYDVRLFRNTLLSYINQSALEQEVKFLVLKDLTVQAKKEADALVVREAAELEKAAQLKKAAEEKAAGKESEAWNNGD